MNRKELDALAAHHDLTVDTVESMMELADARPTGREIARFGVRLLHLAGVLSLAAGVVFFVAANWSALAVFGRFALVEAVLAVAVGVALWRPPPEAVGRYALLLAFLVTGGLLALFGQTYQTGADVYELFLSWTVFGLAFVVAARWSVAWAAWVLVLNVALWLFCGTGSQTGLLWLALSVWDWDPSQLLLVPLAVDVLLWAVCVRAEDTPWAHLAPAWLGRFTLACAVGVGTWAGLVVIAREQSGAASFVGLVVPLAVFAGIAWHTLRRRRDVFPLAAIEASLIILSTVWIAQYGDFDDTGIFLVLAAWLIVTSTLSGHYLMRLVRRWEGAEGAT